MATLNDEELIYTLETQLADLLDRRPLLEDRVLKVFLRTFARRSEVAAVSAMFERVEEELEAVRQEIRRRAGEEADDRELIRQEIKSAADGATQDRQLTRQEMAAGFEQVDQRFEQVDQRFEQVDQRFEQIDQRFEQVDQRFVELGRRTDLLQMATGRILTRLGHKLEDTVASALRYGLKRPDIHPEHILLRQKIVDAEKAVFPRRKEKEIDIVAMNDEHIIFEVKSSAKPDDVDDVAEIVELYQLQNPTVKTRGALITLAPRQDVPK